MAIGDKLFVADKATLDLIKADTNAIKNNSNSSQQILNNNLSYTDATTGWKEVLRVSGKGKVLELSANTTNVSNEYYGVQVYCDNVLVFKACPTGNGSSMGVVYVDYNWLKVTATSGSAMYYCPTFTFKPSTQLIFYKDGYTYSSMGIYAKGISLKFENELRVEYLKNATSSYTQGSIFYEII